MGVVLIKRMSNDSTQNLDKNNEEKKEKSSSSYYLYKSTDKEEAKKYAPKKLDTTTAQKVESDVVSKSKGSTWNTGATMEQFDYSEWMKQRIEQLLINIKFKDCNINIHEVVKVEGSATILLIRGKYRPGYDISFECKWHDITNKAKGILKMHDITSEDDPEDWEYEVTIKKKTKVNKAGLGFVKKDKQSVLEAIKVFVTELKEKKKL